MIPVISHLQDKTKQHFGSLATWRHYEAYRTATPTLCAFPCLRELTVTWSRMDASSAKNSVHIAPLLIQTDREVTSLCMHVSSKPSRRVENDGIVPLCASQRSYHP